MFYLAKLPAEGDTGRVGSRWQKFTVKVPVPCQCHQQSLSTATLEFMQKLKCPRFVSLICGSVYHGCFQGFKSILAAFATTHTSSTAQGGGGSFKNRKPIGEICCCESGMAERIRWWTERCLRSPLFLSLSLTIYPPTNLSSMYLSIYLSVCLSVYLSVYLSICLSICQLSICGAVSFSVM